MVAKNSEAEEETCAQTPFQDWQTTAAQPEQDVARMDGAVRILAISTLLPGAP